MKAINVLLISLGLAPFAAPLKAQEADPWAPYKAPAIEPSAIFVHDNEGNRSAIYGLRMGYQGLGGRVNVSGLHRTAELGPLAGISSYLSGMYTHEGDRTYSRLEVGANLRDVRGENSSTSAFFAGRFAYRPQHWNDRLRVGLNGSVLPFDETARLIAARINVVEGTVDASYSYSRLTLLGVASLASISKGTAGDPSNKRASALLEAMYLLVPGIQMGLGVKGHGYNNSPAISYFAPEMMVLPEVMLRLDTGGKTGWGIEGEGALGAQAVRFSGNTDNRNAGRVNLALRFRPGVGQEIAVTGGFANVASLSTTQAIGYKSYTLGVRGRIHF